MTARAQPVSISGFSIQECRRRKMGASFKDLVVWQRAVELCLAVYKMTSKFPDSERFGLTNQLRRAAVSIASNIAEGYGRSTKGEYILFLGHARGSLCELQTQLIISGALQMGMEEMRRSAETLSADVSRMLIAIMAKLRDQKAHSAL
jgi:four helix bundle protein